MDHRAVGVPPVAAARGFAFLEVMVAILVVSVGLLGLSAMQLQGLRTTSVAYQRTLATAAAQDGVERLWVKLWENPDVCPDPADVMTQWYAAWNGILEGMEASGSQIAADAAGSCSYSVTLQWSNARFADETDVARLVYRARLPGEIAP